MKRSDLTAAIITEIVELLDGGEIKTAEAMQEYKSRSNLIGKKITVSPVIGENKTDYTGTAIGITDEAKLEVRLSDGTVKYLDSGEVSLHTD